MHKKSNLSLDYKNFKMGEISLWNKGFLKYTLDTIIGTPRNSCEKNISDVYSHSYSQFWALQGDYKHGIIQKYK